MPNSSTPLLESRAVGRRHPNGKDWLLENVSLSIYAGDSLAVLGPSGAGKTILLRLLALLDPVDMGEVLWQGRGIAGSMAPAFRREVTYLQQRPALFDGSVEDNLRVPFSLKVHAGARFDREWIIERLSRLGRSEEFLAQQANSLSGGESQLVAVLRSLQLGPRVLLFDEPTASLDREASDAVEQLAAEWLAADDSRAMVWVSHNRDQAIRMSDQVFHMAGGRLLGPPGDEEIASSPA